MAFSFITGASQQKRSGRPFIIKVNYASGFTVTLPLYNLAGYNYNFIVDWGDGVVGQVTSATDTDRVHTYSSGGTYTIKMTGTLEGWSVNNGDLKLYLTEVVQWGRTGLRYIISGFQGCTRLTACYGKLESILITSFFNMFYGCSALTSVSVSDWNVSACTNFTNMFNGCTGLTSLDTSAWTLNTTASINMANTFAYCSNLITIGDTSGWNTSKVTSFSGTFYECNKLKSIDADINGLDVSTWNTGSCTNMGATFYNCKALTNLDVSSWDISKVTTFVTSFYGTFDSCIGLTSLDTSAWTWNTTSNVLTTRLFAYCSNLITIGDTSGWNTSKVTSFNSLFLGCTKLKSIDADVNGLDVSTWDLSSCTSFQNMFYGCSALTSVSVSDWNVSACTNFTNMFNGCTGLTSLDTSAWTLNTTASINMINTFVNCSNITALYFTSWNTSKVTSFSGFLSGCTGLTTCDVSVLNTSSCTNISYMFQNCHSMTAINISGWDLSLVTAENMTQHMFYGCYGLTSLTLPSSLSRVDNSFARFTGTPACTQYNIYRSAAPIVSGTPFENNAKPLHVPVSNSGYDVAPWTNTAIFSSIINDL